METDQQINPPKKSKENINLVNDEKNENSFINKKSNLLPDYPENDPGVARFILIVKILVFIIKMPVIVPLWIVRAIYAWSAFLIIVITGIFKILKNILYRHLYNLKK